jgi:hypothetical protein
LTKPAALVTKFRSAIILAVNCSTFLNLIVQKLVRQNESLYFVERTIFSFLERERGALQFVIVPFLYYDLFEVSAQYFFFSITITITTN